MEQQDLQDVMRFQLNNLKKEDVEITDDTIHKDVLDTEGFGPANSRDIYQVNIQETFYLNNEPVKIFPAGWMEDSVKGLAAKLLLMMLLFFSSFVATAQLNLSIGANKTTLKNSAIGIGLTYVKSLDSIWGHKVFFKGAQHSLFTISPEANIVTGNQDAFSSINIKAVGMWMLFQTTTVSGLKTPNSAKTMHCFPFSIGMETNNLFNTINGMVEIGYVPWYQAYTRNLPDWMKRTKLGIFYQAGYKFYVDSTGKKTIGGQVDQSAELTNRTIMRAKASFGINTGRLIKINDIIMGLTSSGDAWYDIMNGVWYHRIQTTGKFYLSNTSSLDFSYINGSGAPNFNQGNEYGIGLTVTF